LGNYILAFGIFTIIAEVAITFCLLFSTEKDMKKLRQTIAWATFWAIFSQAQLVALIKWQLHHNS
jgi:uncharacterized membrane protein YvlD (DUF360 family)